MSDRNAYGAALRAAKADQSPANLKALATAARELQAKIPKAPK